MKDLRNKFFIFFILLAGTISFLLFHSYNQMDREEKVLWQGIAENIYNQLQANISEFLTNEDKRSFSEYRYYYVPEGQVKTSLIISPLANVPQNDSKGLIGYFQIDPDGSFHTPYLTENPTNDQLTDIDIRQKLHTQLKDLTKSFALLENPKDFSTYATKKADNDAIELGTSAYLEVDGLKDTDEEEDDKSDSRGSGRYSSSNNTPSSGYESIYPNPIIEKSNKSKKSKITDGSVSEAKDQTTEFRRKISASPVQYQAFENQAGTSSNSINQKVDQDTIFEEISDVEKDESSFLFIDPLRARLVDQNNIVFYRKVWLKKKMYIQGFAVELSRFYNWLMLLSFENSKLPEFSQALLVLDNHIVGATKHVAPTSHIHQTIFKRALGYPLNLFTWRIDASYIPHTTARMFLNILSGVIILIATLGLYLIYKSTALQVLLSQKREDFVSAVTHELKTPLTSIRMYSEMLEQGWIKDEVKKLDYYRLINKEGGRLSRLIENILQLARLEKKSYKINLIKESPTKDFEELVKEIEPITNQQGFQFMAQSDSNLPVVSYDPDAVKQILLTFVDNSLKFGQASENKIIEMSLTSDGSSVVWAIHDKGPGIPQEHLKRIFEKFYRVENELTRKTKGTGIGLAMAKMLAEEMGARIEAENRVGGGISMKLIFI